MARKRRPHHRVIFRDVKGRFVKGAERYTDKVKMVQGYRGGEYVKLVERKPTPELLADVLNQREFESLPEALVKLKDFKPKGKYQAWNLAEQIDKTKRIRRKNLKFTLTIQDGKRRKVLEFYHHIKRNTASSYQIFRRINQEIGLEGMFLYDKVGGKHIADRKGKQVTIVGMKVEEII